MAAGVGCGVGLAVGVGCGIGLADGTDVGDGASGVGLGVTVSMPPSGDASVLPPGDGARSAVSLTPHVAATSRTESRINVKLMIGPIAGRNRFTSLSIAASYDAYHVGVVESS